MKTKQVEYIIGDGNSIGYLYNFKNIEDKAIYKTEMLARGFDALNDLADALAMMNDNAQDADVAYHLLMVISQCESVLSRFDQDEVNVTLYTVRKMVQLMEDK